MKILISILFLFISFFSFAEDNPWDYVEELTTELEASNELIIQLREEIKTLEERPTQEEYDLVVNQLEETTDELIISNELIISLRNELYEAQKEITFFRERYEESVLTEATQTNFGFGGGVTWPNGGELIFILDVPFINTLSIYARGGIQVNNFFHGGAGIIYRY